MLVLGQQVTETVLPLYLSLMLPFPPSSASARPTFEQAVAHARRRWLVLHAVSVGARALAASALAYSLAVLTIEASPLVRPLLVWGCFSAGILGAGFSFWRSRISPSVLVEVLDQRLRTHELLATAWYCCTRSGLPQASVEQVTRRATNVLAAAPLRALLPSGARRSGLVLLAAMLTSLALLQLGAPASSVATAPPDTPQPPRSERLARDGSGKPLSSIDNEPPPIADTLQAVEHLAREAERSVNGKDVRKRAQQLSEWVLHHLAALRADPNAGVVADYLSQTLGMNDVADAMRRSDWVRFQAAIQQHQRSQPTADEAWLEALARARAIIRPREEGDAPGVVAQALRDAVLSMQEQRQADAPRLASAGEAEPQLPASLGQRETQAGLERAPQPGLPTPLTRHDLARDASRRPDLNTDGVAERAQLRSSELDALQRAGQRHQGALPSQRDGAVDAPTTTSLAVQQRELGQALEALRLMANGESPRASFAAEPLAAGPALAEGSSLPRTTDNPRTSDGTSRDARREVATSPTLSPTGATPRPEQVRAPMSPGAPLAAGVPGRHASSFGRGPTSSVIAQRSVLPPDRVLPLGHSPVPVEYRAQISRYFAPE